MNLSVTTLIDNSVGMKSLEMEDLIGEWGLSVLLRTDSRSILLDTGRSGCVVANARVLGVDLSSVDTIVLSHGHLDHTGGLRRVLQEIGQQVQVIAHPEVWSQKYITLAGRPERFVNIPFQPQELERLGARFSLSSEPFKIARDIMTTGTIPLTNDVESIRPPSGMERYVKHAGGRDPDTIADDLAVVINSADGLVVLLGCAHRGIVNTLHHAQRITGRKKIHAVLGGAHLHDASEDRIRFVIQALKEMDVEMVGLNHCTGHAVACRLQRELGDRFRFNPAGTSFAFRL